MSFKELVDATMIHGKAVVSENSSTGINGNGAKIDNTQSAWWLKNKGYSSQTRAIRVEHPVHGLGTVSAITESNVVIAWDNLDNRITSPNTLAFADAKYLTRLTEQHDTRADTHKGKKRIMKKKMKKTQVKESLVASGMAAVNGTHRDNGSVDMFGTDDILRFDDLLAEDDDWNESLEDSDDSDDSNSSRSEKMDGDVHGLRNADAERDYKGSGSNVPRPSDSILTNQDEQPNYSATPLSTMDGFDAAGDGDEVDGDYQDDLLPVDAPETPQALELEGSGYRGNARDTGDDNDDTAEVSTPNNNESTPDDDGGEDEMKTNESAWLDAEDLGIELNEMDNPIGGMDFDQPMGENGGMNEHEMGAGEIAFTRELLDKLCSAISTQTPDAAMCKALCDGFEAAQQEKGDSGLGVDDWDSIKSHAASAYDAGGMEADTDGSTDEYSDDYDSDMDECGGDMEEYEDRAEGDGEEAGPEGGSEHEGKTKMFDTKGTPIGTGSNSGPGGGSTTDLSKPKAYNGKPVGTGTSGAGGSNSNEFGQKPSEDGGSNNLPAYSKGSKLGAAGNPFSKGEAAPRRSKALAAESRKARKNGKKKVDEAIMLGMSVLPGTIRDDYSNVPADADWNDELKSIKRLAGMDEWWKD
jgi:hypothetical protein